MNTLRTHDLQLEPLRAQHAPAMFAVLCDPAIYEFENEPPSSEAALEQRYARLESRASADGAEIWLNWVVRLPSGDLAGFLQATVLAEGQAYVAYVLASRFWRQGIASQAVARVLRELAEHYAVRNAFAVLKAANFRSLGLLSKLGFKVLPPGVSPPWAAELDEITMHHPLQGILTRPSMQELTGGCLCGHIRYRLTGAPLVARICWCRDCQHVSGNGTVNAIFPAAAIEIEGNPGEYVSLADSGNNVRRKFCARCGSHLFAENTGRPGFTVVRVGTLDDPSSISPTANIWASSAPAWACLDATLDRFEKQPQQLQPPAGTAISTAQTERPPQATKPG